MGPRLLGLDLARMLALTGMVLVHGWTDLVLVPLEGTGGVLPAGPEGPAWAVALQSLATDRARPLFVLVAGVGVTLMTSRTGAGARVLLLRALFLGLLGAALLLYGWSDLVLVAYGLLFLLAVPLLRAPTLFLVVLAGLTWASPVALAVLTGSPADGGPVPVVAEFGYFFLGLALARLDLTRTRAVLALTGGAALTGALGAGGLVALRASLAAWSQRASWLDLALGELLTAGAVVAALGACLLLGARVPQSPRPVRTTTLLLATAGAMPLSVYVAHALLYPAVAPVLGADLVSATAFGAVYLAVAVAATALWGHAGRRGRPPRRGPVEELMRRASRTARPT